jgi:hypothetical protein
MKDQVAVAWTVEQAEGEALSARAPPEKRRSPVSWAESVLETVD